MNVQHEDDQNRSKVALENRMPHGRKKGVSQLKKKRQNDKNEKKIKKPGVTTAMQAGEEEYIESKSPPFH